MGSEMVPFTQGTKILIPTLIYFHKVPLLKNKHFPSLHLRPIEVEEDEWLATSPVNYEKTWV